MNNNELRKNYLKQKNNSIISGDLNFRIAKYYRYFELIKENSFLSEKKNVPNLWWINANRRVLILIKKKLFSIRYWNRIINRSCIANFFSYRNYFFLFLIICNLKQFTIINLYKYFAFRWILAQYWQRKSTSISPKLFFFFFFWKNKKMGSLIVNMPC